MISIGIEVVATLNMKPLNDKVVKTATWTFIEASNPDSNYFESGLLDLTI